MSVSTETKEVADLRYIMGDLAHMAYGTSNYSDFYDNIVTKAINSLTSQEEEEVSGIAVVTAPDHMQEWEYENVSDVEFSEAGFLTLLDPDGKLVATFAPGHWSSVSRN